MSERENAYLNQLLTNNSLYDFVRTYWPVVVPRRPFKDNWHIGAICEHLEACTVGQIRKLVINVPPRSMKSLLVGVFWFAWSWTFLPQTQWLYSSYNVDLAIRDSLKCRRLIGDHNYQERFGDVFQLAGDQNLKSRFENDMSGHRLSVGSGGGATGEGGDFIVCLDGSSVIGTDCGPLEIAHIVNNRLPVRVMAFDHDSGNPVWADIVAYERNPGKKSVAVKMTNGAELRATVDHPVYVFGDGYVNAANLVIGDEVVHLREKAYVAAIEVIPDIEVVYNLKVTGQHNYFANGILVHNCDDPHKVKEAESDVSRLDIVRWWDETMSTRGNDPETSVFVVVMQRLHERDLSGHILASEQGYENLMLPMRFEEDRKCFTSLPWQDPRKKDGEMLWPSRFTEDYVSNLEKTLGEYGTAGQLQQRPAPRGGGMFKEVWFKDKVIAKAPDDIVATVLYWDKAATEGGGDYTVGLVMSRDKADNIYVESVTRAQLGSLARDEMIKSTSTIWKSKRPNLVIYIEREGGGAGKDMMKFAIKQLAGLPVKQDIPSGDKVTRATPFATYSESGNVYIIKAAWNDVYLQELCVFPHGAHDDIVDAASGAFNKLFLKKYREPSSYEYQSMYEVE